MYENRVRKLQCLLVSILSSRNRVQIDQHVEAIFRDLSGMVEIQ